MGTKHPLLSPGLASPLELWGVNHRSVYMAPGLLAADTISLSQSRKRVLAHSLAGLREDSKLYLKATGEKKQAC